MKKICVIGLGYIGLPTAILFALKGFKVLGFDKNNNSFKYNSVIPCGTNDNIKNTLLQYLKSINKLNDKEILACDDLIKKLQQKISLEDSTVKGFNVGTNSGKVAGQSIFHCHIHVIPRREGDVENPQGGVRSVIPSKQHYIRKK